MRAVVTGMVVLAALLVMPGTASAQWRWLEKLSGPGPFVIVQGELKLHCQYEGTVEDGSSGQENALSTTLSAPCIFVEKTADRSPLNRKLAVGVGTGLGVSLDNALTYERRHTSAETRVYLVPLEAFIDINPCATFTSSGTWFTRWCRRIDVGAFGGVHWFFGRGSGNVVPSTVHPILGLRGSYSLFAFGKQSDSTFRGSLKARGGVLWYPRGLKGKDFGALQGWKESGSDPIAFGALVLDLDRIK